MIAANLRPGHTITRCPDEPSVEGWKVAEVTVFPLPHGPDWSLFCPGAHRIPLTLERLVPSPPPLRSMEHVTRTAWLSADAEVEASDE